jgi:hypothetical protein
MPFGVTWYGHVYDERSLVTFQDSLICVSLNLRELRESLEYDVVPNEFGSVLKEAISNEYRTVVHPVVTWCGGQHNPLIGFRNFNEGLNPSACTHQSLFIEYEEGIFYIRILLDVVK